MTLCFSVSCEKEAAPTTTPELAAPDAGESGEEAEGDTGAEEPEAAAEPATWADMDRKQRMTHMGTVVMPKMKESFQASNAEQYEKFKCQTCHGDDMKEVDFKMPNAITPLAAADPLQSGMDMDEEVAKFMNEFVMVQMGELLSMEADPKGEKGGVSCFTCHLKEE
jgi:hypothetical protein